MASAYYDEDADTWTLSFLPLGRGKRRGVRMRSTDIPLPRDQHGAHAKALAEECDRYCRLLEVSSRADDIRHALRIRAITEAQAQALLASAPPPPASAAPQRLTIQQAAQLHPSTQRTPAAGRWTYLAYLEEFEAFAGITLLADVTLDQVQRWIADLKARYPSWDTRRHRLLYLRRATRMGAMAGIPDVLGELVLDRQGRRPPVQAWTLDELADGALALASSPRARVALALGGFVGLRPSEIFRVDCGDLRLDGMLPVGIEDEQQAKNEPSRRLLPIPPTVAAWMRDLASGRGADEPLVYAQRGTPPKHPERDPERARRQRRRFTDVGFAHWLGPLLETATGRDLPPKALRKAFASWATRARLDAQHVEQYLGHENDLVASITGRHYLSDVHELVAVQTKPTCRAIERTIRKALAAARARAERPERAAEA